MSFPRTSVLDDFDRANGDAGANWAEMMRSGNDFNISSNQLVDDGWNAETWQGDTYGPDCEVFVTIATLQGQGKTMIAYARMADVTADAYAYDGYGVLAYRWDDDGTDTMTLKVSRYDNGAATQLGAAVNITDHGNGDTVGLRCMGAALEAWYDDGAGWELRAQRSDGTYSSAGYLALYLPDSTAAVDDFGGGAISTVPAKMHSYRQRRL